MVRYCVLGSGSSGNSYVFQHGTEAILVDNGFSRVELKRRLAGEGFDFDALKAVFVTHLHPDHSKGVGTLARMDGLPVYVSRRCFQLCGDNEYARLGIPVDCRMFLDEGETCQLGAFSVYGFSTCHDSGGSMGYCIQCDGFCFTIVTDTGCYDEAMIECARHSDVLFLESNYDRKMLDEGPYPFFLKKRISGTRGHLSNDQAEQFLHQCGIFESNTEEINSDLCYNPLKSRMSRVFLVHLSDTNNSVSLLQRRFRWMGDLLTVCPKGNSESGCIGES